MAKFSGPSVIPGAQPTLPVDQSVDFSDLLGGPEQTTESPAAIPTGPAPEAAPGLPEVQEQPIQTEATAEEQAGLEDIALAQEQRARERVPSLGERTGLGTLTDYVIKQDDPLSAALERGARVNQQLQYDPEGSSLRASVVGQRAEQLKGGFAEAAFSRTDAEGNVIKPEHPTLAGGTAAIGATSVLYDPRILDAGIVKEDGYIGVDPEFSSIMSLATEAWLYNQAQGAGPIVDEVPEFGDSPEAAENLAQATTGLEISKAKGNQQLGREIYREWKRQKAAREGTPTDAYVAEEAGINPDTFTFIGDMAKEVYAQANPGILYRPEGKVAEGEQTYFQLTPEGAKQLETMNTATLGLFEQPEVQPLTAVSPTAQPIFEAKTRVRPVTTKVGDLKDWSQVQESMANYHSVAYVNDPQRESLAMQFGILALLNHSSDNVYANMFDLGSERQIAVEGKRTKMLDEASRADNPEERAKLEREAAAYNPVAVMSRDRNKFLNIMGGLADYSGRANHVTFSMQGLTGRTHIQQTVYNPQAHKPVRFVVGGGNVYTWTPGSGVIDRNFREIMAAHFVRDDHGTKGKNLTTEERLKNFDKQLANGQLDGYIQMGQELAQATANFDKAGAREALSQIRAAVAAGDQQVLNNAKREIANKFGQDPLSDATKAELAKHGDEAPYTAEALIELAKYADAKKNGKPMSSTINVEMDGKTHGPATNAALLGIEGMAKRTGLIRSQDYTLTDDLDSRDAMGLWMNENVDHLAGTLFPFEQLDAYKSMLAAAVKDRGNFLKKSPMTMGYGQELSSLSMHVETTIFNGPSAPVIQEIINDPSNDLNTEKAISFLHTMLVDSIYNVMDPKVVEVARLLRANNLVATLTDEVLYMDNAMGFRSYAAAKQMIEEETGSATYEFTEGGKRIGRSAQFYREKPAGSAVRAYQAGSEPVPGGFGHGRVIPISVQSYDGNMISRTGSGSSWDRIQSTSKARGGKNPFVLPIFDAFKTDLGSFDVVREESNRNWVNGMQNHSYVTAIMDGWFNETAKKFRTDMSALDPNQKHEVNMNTKWRGLWYMFNVTDDNGKPMLQKLLSKITHAPAKEAGVTIDEYQQSLARAAGKQMSQILKRMDAKGIPAQFEELTTQQIRDTINIIMDEIGIVSRNKSTVNRIQSDKDKLFAKFKGQGRDARQVDIA